MTTAELSNEDKNLAQKVGYDPKALEIVKRFTQSRFEEFTVNSSGEPYGLNSGPYDFESQSLESLYTVEEKVDWLNDLAKKVPELSTLVLKEIEILKVEDSKGMQEARSATTEHNKKIQAVLQQFMPYFEQAKEEYLDNHPELRGQSLGIAQIRHRTDTKNKSPEELRAELETQFKDKVLADRFKPKTVLSFYLPTKEYSFSIGQEVEYTRKNAISSSKTTHELISEIQKELRPLGFHVMSLRSLKRTSLFRTLDEAKHFVDTLPIPQTQVSITKKPEFRTDYPIDLLKSAGSLMVPPLSVVERINKSTIRATVPSTYSVSQEVTLGILAKAITGSNSKPSKESNTATSLDKFDLVRSAGTSGPNYSVDTRMVIEKLKHWDSLYGVEIQEAKHDTVRLTLDKLPNDLSELCTEIWLLCPDAVELSSDYLRNASAMRSFAQRLRETKQITLWWD